MARRPTFQLSEQTLAVLAVFQQLRQGETVPYERLTAALGEDAQEEGRHHVDRARHVMRRDLGRVLEPIPSVGIKWLTDPEVVQLGPAAIEKGRRHFRRNHRKIALADPANLSLQEQALRSASLAHCASLYQQADVFQVRRTQASIANGCAPVPIPTAPCPFGVAQPVVQPNA